MSMDKQEVLNLFIEASKLMSIEPNKCGNLFYTQKKSGKHIIREPEATYIISNLLHVKGINFGLEVPTKKRYIISGKSPDSANIDLAINPNGKQVNIEFKRGQPYYDKSSNDVESVRKDFDKLLREPTYECAFFHILKNSNKGTLSTLLRRYCIAYNNTLNLKDKQPKWFLFFIYVKEKNECFWQLFDDITDISEDDFELDNFSREELS